MTLHKVALKIALNLAGKISLSLFLAIKYLFSLNIIVLIFVWKYKEQNENLFSLENVINSREL